MKKLLIVSLGLIATVTLAGCSSNQYNTNTSDYNTSSQSSCCKICSKGKACGNSCISQSYTCHQPVGCACDG